MKANYRNLTALISYSVSFAFVEAAVVDYLRHLLAINTYQLGQYKIVFNLGVIAAILPQHPLLGSTALTSTEMLRELATIVMLLSAAYLAGSNLRQRLAAFVIAFSIWDLMYYVFLLFLVGWPTSLKSLDIYFLLPVPIMGPVLTPILLFLLLLVLGLKVYLQFPGRTSETNRSS